MTTHSAGSGESESVGNAAFDITLLEQYWLGETSPDVTTVVEAWLAANPEWDTWYERLRHEITEGGWGDLSPEHVNHIIAGTFDTLGLHHGAERLTASGDFTAVLAEPCAANELDASVPARSIVTSPGETLPSVASATSSVRFISQRVRVIGMGLTAAIMVALTAFGVRQWVEQKNSMVAAEARASLYTTGKGQRVNLLLDDGTHVMLGVMSTLRYAVDAETGVRTVHLTGEAYFEVLPNPTAPLVIHAGQTATRVLGTSFSVRHYTADSSTRVVVTSGKVAFDRTVLSAGDVGVRSLAGISVARDVKTGSLLAWTTGRLIFERQSLRDVLTELSRWYDVEFHVDDPKLLTTTISSELANRTIKEVADVIAASLGVRYEQIGKHITFYSRES